MSGHSKFANIKHKKEKNDAAKGKIFTIIGREIAVAVKEGGPDPENNSKLRDVIAKAKANNMPNDTINNEYVEFVRKPLLKGLVDRCVFGANYVNSLDGTDMWICPVTLFVLGRYPKYLYIKHNKSYYNKINKTYL